MHRQRRCAARRSGQRPAEAWRRQPATCTTTDVSRRCSWTTPRLAIHCSKPSGRCVLSAHACKRPSFLIPDRLGSQITSRPAQHHQERQQLQLRAAASVITHTWSRQVPTSQRWRQLGVAFYDHLVIGDRRRRSARTLSGRRPPSGWCWCGCC